MANSFELLQPALFLVVFLVIALLSLNFLAAKNVKYPPVIKGWIPWLGCAIDFGKEPLNFIKKSTEKHGVIFTVYAAGQRMTFLTDVSDFHVFFNSPHADFQRAFEGEVKKTVGINKIDFFANHRNVHDLIKGRLSSSNLHKLTPKVGKQLEEYIRQGMFGGFFLMSILASSHHDYESLRDVYGPVHLLKIPVFNMSSGYHVNLSPEGKFHCQVNFDLLAIHFKKSQIWASHDIIASHNDTWHTGLPWVNI